MPHFMRHNIETIKYGDHALFRTGSEALPRDTEFERNTRESGFRFRCKFILRKHRNLLLIFKRNGLNVNVEINECVFVFGNKMQETVRYKYRQYTWCGRKVMRLIFF